MAGLQAVLAERNQFQPLDPPNAETATIGGILATNAFGPSRLGYGTARDWLIGLTIADGEGRLVKGGGKVVKTETWGLRSLAYRIAKNRKAHYVMLEFEAPGPVVAELERQTQINANVIRYTTTATEDSQQGPSARIRRNENR